MLVDHLRKTFSERSKRNPRYSLRAFARSLEMDSSTLSAIMNGKRPVTVKTAQKILERLDVKNEFEAERILLESIGTKRPVAPEYDQIELEKFEVIGSWEHFAIMALLELDDFEATDRNVAARLNIPFGIAVDCLRRLERLELVRRDDDEWVPTRKNLATPSNVPNQSLRRANRQYIERALTSLENDAVDERDVTGMTMAIDSSKLDEAKTLIKDFRRKLSAFLETGSRDEVYRLNVQLFPLTTRRTR